MRINSQARPLLVNMMASAQKNQEEVQVRNTKHTEEKLENFDEFHTNTDLSSRIPRHYSSYEKGNHLQDQINLSLTQAKELYEVYTNEGKNLKFNSVKSSNYNKLKSLHQIKQSPTYNVRIEIKEFGPVSYKLMTLTEINSNTGDNSLTGSSVSNSNRHINRECNEVNEDSKTESPENNINEHEEEDMPSDFVETDERHESKNITPRLMDQTFNLIQNIKGSSPPYLDYTESPITTDRNLSSTRNLLHPKKQKEVDQIKEVQTLPQIPNQKRNKRRSSRWNNNALELSGEGDELSNLSSLRGSTVSEQMKISKMYKNAVARKYVPYFYKLAIIFLYISFAGFWVNQSFFYVIKRRNIADMEMRKEIILLAQSMNENIGVLHRRFRLIWSFISGNQVESDYPPTYKVSGILKTTKSAVELLAKTTHTFLNSTAYLDDEYKKAIFQSNIRFFDINSEQEESSIYLTMTQAIEKLSQFLLEALK